MPTADHRPAATAHAPPAVQVGNAIALHADELRRDGHSTLHLRLDPPGLGSVRVHLTATEQNVSARVVVEAESTRQLLENQAGLLRDRLMESGVTLGRFTVACDSSGGGRQQGASPQPPREELPLPLSKPRLAAPSSRPRIGNGLVDVVV
jgi:hypothetical protein